MRPKIDAENLSLRIVLLACLRMILTPSFSSRKFIHKFILQKFAKLFLYIPTKIRLYLHLQPNLFRDSHFRYQQLVSYSHNRIVVEPFKNFAKQNSQLGCGLPKIFSFYHPIAIILFAARDAPRYKNYKGFPAVREFLYIYFYMQRQ